MPENRELEALYRASFGFVFQKAKKLLQNEADAVEVSQETYLRAFKHWSSVQDHPSPIGWLLMTTARLSIDRLRRAHLSRKKAPLLRSADPADPREKLEASMFVEALLDEESELTQLIICHVLLDGMTQEETALVLEISRKTVQRHLLRFKEKCGRLFAEGDEVLRHA